MKQNNIDDIVVPLLGSYNLENAFNVYQDQDSRYFYNLLQNIYFPDGLDPSVFSVEYPHPGELLPQLSYRMYNVVNLWWVIAHINNIDNPLEPLDPSTRVKILNPSVITDILNTIKGS